MFETLTDDQLSVLHDLLEDESIRRVFNTGGRSQEYWDTCTAMYAAVCAEVKRRPVF